ncbi:hypothetical protein NUW58_g6439 [Xylaria curta]|uniref:Uncharacterized protein n=1 Tax=Xylaria curta TaxID=42375 RepID=A0ACC1NUB2_9PEZI|nr:hypothetical protein NUW58_g6439 [Xylaria curta]
MSDGRRVKFSPSPPPRGVLKHTEPNPRDSGVGSSSSDHTGSSGSLDERFTARDYNVQSSNVDALREALANVIKDLEHWKTRYSKKSNEQAETRKSLRNTETLYREECERTQTLRAEVASMEDRMEKQDVALGIANSKISELELNLTEWKDKYQELDNLYQDLRHPTSASMISGGSGEHSLGHSRSHRERDSAELTSRMKERINRDQPDTATSHASKSSRSSEATVSTKRTGHRTNTSTSDSSKPYIEKMPRASTSSLASPRQPGSYTLTTADRSSSRRHGTASTSRPGYREHGDYIPHPLPDRTR